MPFDCFESTSLTQNEAAVLESLQRERSLRGFAPQYMGCVERDGRTYIKSSGSHNHNLWGGGG